MNWKKSVYFCYASFRGYRFPHFLNDYFQDYKQGNLREVATQVLRRLLLHCRNEVPYYAKLFERMGSSDLNDVDPQAFLQRLPILTKETIRANLSELQSKDLSRRKWFYNTSGGSTGEPVRFIQDADFNDRSKAVELLFHSLLGYETGQLLVRLWGSEQDIEGRTIGWKARFFNWLTSTTFLNAFRMSREQMREFLRTMNQRRPRLILAYAQAMYELARFAESERVAVESPHAIVTSAGTLYPFMREKIAQVFGCPVYNRYGSREVGGIACELPGIKGLWVAPWGNFVEIVDDDGRLVPMGTAGNILVTCLTNYAMPLVRYQIGDRGLLGPDAGPSVRPMGQILEQVTGRNVDVFRTRENTLVDGEYFTHLLYFRPWVWKFQVIQKSHRSIVFKVIKAGGGPAEGELEEIAAKARLTMSPDCQIDFEFVDELPPHPSGKYRYTISEVGV
jgi:phenylacetate-CoA ligase